MLRSGASDSMEQPVSLALNSQLLLTQIFARSLEFHKFDVTKVQKVQLASQSDKYIAKVFNWIETDTNVRYIHDDLKRTAFRERSNVDPQLALHTAQDQPLGPSKIGWEGAVINSFVVTNKDVARAMLDNVPSGATRIDEFDSVIVFSLFERDLEAKLLRIVTDLAGQAKCSRFFLGPFVKR